MKIVVIIPARYASTRLPGKPLADIFGIPMIKRVAQQVSKSPLVTAVYIATDHEDIVKAAHPFKCIMTSVNHNNGTERLLEAYEKLEGKYDLIINVQGDEPFFDPIQIEEIASIFENEEVEIGTLVKKIGTMEELKNPSQPKVVLGIKNRALYFSRAAIPFLRDVPKAFWLQEKDFYRHVGVYAYRPKTLIEIANMKQTNLEMMEALEQLRWLENGKQIFAALTKSTSFAVDTPEDLEKANEIAREIN